MTSINVVDHLDEASIKKLKRIRDDFPYFSRNFLKIKNERGDIVPFELNEAQMYIHKKLEEQLKETGRVRALILKGRQMGASTYLEGRYYHKASTQEGKNVFILAHENESSKKIFTMARRFYDNVPDLMKPKLKATNAKELIFDGIDSQYYVGTAGNADVGRGGTVQYLHGSETAFWPHTDEIATGLMQSIPDGVGTEIVLESTANGLGNYFYKLCVDALAKKSDYQLIFTPWHWMDKYERDYPQDFNPDEDALKIAELYLDKYDKEKQLRKLYWRERKIIEFGSLNKFHQEYPCNIQEAFVSSGESLCRAEDVVRARKCYKKDKHAAVIIGVDPARSGDRTAIAIRRGRELMRVITHDDMDEMRLVGLLIKLIDEYGPSMVNIDVALGYGTVDRLLEHGYRYINGVHFGERAIENDIYRNKRAEMWCTLAKWLENEDINIPDDDEVHADIMCVPDIVYTSDGTIKLAPKEKIREACGKSPDIGDAIALTFAYPARRLDQKIADMKKKSGNIQKGANKASWKQVKREGANAPRLLFK